MNDELRLQKMLEEATAPGAALPAGLDAETSELREAWLALGRQLAAADAAAGPPRVVLQPADGGTVSSRPWLGLLALAASLLLAVGALVLFGRGPLIAERPAGGAPPAAAALSASTAGETVAGWEWDETIDSEISNAAQQMVVVGQEHRTSSAWYSEMGEELLEIQNDLNDGTF